MAIGSFADEKEGVSVLDFYQIVNRASLLDQQGNLVDTLVRSVVAHALTAVEFAARGVEGQLEGQRQRIGIVPRCEAEWVVELAYGMPNCLSRLAASPVEPTVISNTLAIEVPIAPSYRVVLPKTMLSATMRPWRLAGLAR